MGDTLVVISGLSRTGEWEETWGFERNKKIAFVSDNCTIGYVIPQDIEKVPLVVICGEDKENDIVSNVIDLRRRFTDMPILLLVHPGGGTTLEVSEAVLKQRIQPLKESADKWSDELWEDLYQSVCTYSLLGGTPYERRTGEVVSSIAIHIKNRNQEEFKNTLRALIKSIQEVVKT